MFTSCLQDMCAMSQGWWRSEPRVTEKSSLEPFLEIKRLAQVRLFCSQSLFRRSLGGVGVSQEPQGSGVHTSQVCSLCTCGAGGPGDFHRSLPGLCCLSCLTPHGTFSLKTHIVLPSWSPRRGGCPESGGTAQGSQRVTVTGRLPGPGCPSSVLCV